MLTSASTGYGPRICSTKVVTPLRLWQMVDRVNKLILLYTLCRQAWWLWLRFGVEVTLFFAVYTSSVLAKSLKYIRLLHANHLHTSVYTGTPWGMNIWQFQFTLGCLRADPRSQEYFCRCVNSQKHMRVGWANANSCEISRPPTVVFPHIALSPLYAYQD